VFAALERSYKSGYSWERFRLCRHPIGWLVEIQFIPVRDHLDPVIHLGVYPFAILAGSLVHTSDFLRILRIGASAESALQILADAAPDTDRAVR
jgi:hypothetical protein